MRMKYYLEELIGMEVQELTREVQIQQAKPDTPMEETLALLNGGRP